MQKTQKNPKSLSPQTCFLRCLTNLIRIKKSQKVKLLERKGKKMMDEGAIIQWYDQSLKKKYLGFKKKKKKKEISQPIKYININRFKVTLQLKMKPDKDR